MIFRALIQHCWQGFYALIRFAILFSSWNFWNIVLFGVFCAIYYISELQLKGAAKCIYDETGEIQSAGQDISQGWWEYLYDIIYITMAVQIGSLYSTRFFWLFLAIPLYALYASRSMFGMMSAFSPQNQQQGDDADSNKKAQKGAGDRNARYLATKKK